MWFDSWADVARIGLVGVAAYVALIVIVRVTGKRTLGQLSAFDFIVTVAVGSMFATVLLSSDVSLAEGVAALTLVTALQLLVAWLVSRSAIVQRAVTARPAVLLRGGVIDHQALRRNRVTKQQLEQVVRSSGSGDLSLVAAVVLETNGTFSVVTSERMGDGSAFGTDVGF